MGDLPYYGGNDSNEIRIRMQMETEGDPIVSAFPVGGLPQ